MAKKKSAPKPKAPTKTQVLAELAEATDMSKKEITAVLDALADAIKKALNDKELGAFTIPGLIKISKKHVPARPERKGVLNRLTGQIQDYPAKPASTKVAVRALKGLKEMI